MKYFNLLTALFLFTVSSLAQPYMTRVDSVKVLVSGNPIVNPWTGGLNFCQYSAIDLNMDGIKDLLAFDRTANKINTFINKGTANTVDYVHAPQYQLKFPPLHDWVLAADYDKDGREDLFTYNLGSVSVYRNVSTSTLQFQLLKKELKSTYNSTCTGAGLFLYVSAIDVPALSDIDNDGDLDICTFDVAGGRVEYHRNQSMQKYGNADSLDFCLPTSCWMGFSEGISCYNLSFGVTCKGSAAYDPSNIQHDVHAASCLLCLDLDGDGDKEALIGDGGGICNGLYMLTNIGDSITALASSTYDQTFPSYNVPIDVGTFPCGYSIDVDNDGKKDLIAAPNAINISENFQGNWFYKNTGTAKVPVFSKQQNDFLQDNMIDNGEGAYPSFFDFDADGKMDIVIGNYGYYVSSGGYPSQVSLYKNIGTTTDPKFELQTRDYAGLKTTNIKNISPCFGDLDGDGDQDMMLGDYDGNLYYFMNTAGSGNTAAFALAVAFYKDSANATIDVGQYSAPQLIDVNLDGKLDLIVGGNSGKVWYYQNIGTTSAPVFALRTKFFGQVRVNQGNIYGYSHPFMFSYGGGYRLLVGSQNGYLYHYGNISGNLTGAFTLIDSTFQNIWEGTLTAPWGYDINNDTYMDLVVGNYAGGVSLYYGHAGVGFGEQKAEKLSFELYPNPASNSINLRLSHPGRKAITITDLLGRTLLTHVVTETYATIDVSALPQGTYLCKAETGDKTSGVLRFVVQR